MQTTYGNIERGRLRGRRREKGDEGAVALGDGDVQGRDSVVIGQRGSRPPAARLRQQRHQAQVALSAETNTQSITVAERMWNLPSGRGGKGVDEEGRGG